MNFTLRPATSDDDAFLESLFLQVHQDDFAPLGLDPAKIHSLLAMQARAQRQGYVRDFPGALDQLIYLTDAPAPAGRNPVGRMLVDRTPEALYLIDLALIPAARNAGLGTALLTLLLQQADTQRLPIRLSVLAGNRAFALYSRLGFRVTETRAQAHLQMQYTPGTFVSAAPVSAAPVSAAPPPPPPPDLTHPAVAAWLPHRKRAFQVAPDGPLLHLFQIDPAARSRSFSLIFHGPPDAKLPQGMYTLIPPGDAEAEAMVLFLVPLGPVAGPVADPASGSGAAEPWRQVQQYEAVFN